MERMRELGAASEELRANKGATINAQTACSRHDAQGYLLVSDVDNTLLGDNPSLERFAEWFDQARGSVRLAYNSGRFFESVMQSVSETALPEPDAIIGGVGTDIRVAKGSGTFLPNQLRVHGFVAGKKVPDPFVRLTDWPELDGQWDHKAVRAVLAAHKELEPQPDHLQSEFKVSFFGYDLGATFLDQLRLRYAGLGYAVDVIYSSDRDLDVLPANTNKGTAAAHLAAHWEIEPTNVIVAGDSGNDAPMFDRGFCGIMVGNALPELQAIHGVNAYRAVESCAAGVLEGLRHWLANHPPTTLTSGPTCLVPDGDRGRRG